MMPLKLAAVVFLAAFEIGFIDLVQPDYTFIDSARGYYKIHKEGATWYDARDKCRSEGSLLYHPNTEEEFNIVLNALVVEDKDDFSSWIHAGLSDLQTFKDYRTLDGRSISQVFHKWYAGRPDEITNIKYRCAALHIGSHILDMSECDSYIRRFICKNSHSMEIGMTTAEEIKTTIANSSDKQTTILERLAEAAAKQAAALERLTAHQDVAMERIAEVGTNQTAALERLVLNQDAVMEGIAEVGANITAAIERLAMNQAAAIDRLSVNQAATLEKIAEASAKQAASLERTAVADAILTAAIERIATANTNLATAFERILGSGVNQTAFMERQTLALEKLASSPDTEQ